jgi:putrescine transport system permease protein
LAIGVCLGDGAAVYFGYSHHVVSAQPAGEKITMNRSSRFIFSALCFGFAFLYLPILMLILLSFNDSSIATVWGGFSLRWYSALLSNKQIINAALLSLKIAAVSATFATILGTMAGLALTQMGRYRGRLIFTGLIAAPLVMPEVITGLSLLLLFVSLQELIGWPLSRGASTITIAHITFSMAYVAVIVQSRLANMDQSLEEAAMDLGGRPMQVAFDITLPLIAPSMISGWLLAFTLSLDDLVIASFTSGAGASTLPMVIFSKIKLGVTPDINALASIIIGTVTVGIVIASWIMLRNDGDRATQSPSDP